MSYQQQLLFFFSALGAFNGLVLCIYFLFLAKPKSPSNYFLGSLLGALSIRIGKSSFYYFNYDLAKVYLQIGLFGCFFIGPFLYFYVKSKTTGEAFPKYWKPQLIALLCLYIGVGYVYPYQDFPHLWQQYFYKIINYQWLAYIIATAFAIHPMLKKAIDKNSSLLYDDILILSVFFGVSIIWTAYYTASFTSYIVGAVSFSFILYLTIFLLFYKKQNTNLPESSKKEKYADKQISFAEADALKSKIALLMEKEQVYKHSNLTLSELAKKLNISPHLLSQFLNDNLNKSYSQFINEYRIEEAKKMLVENDHLKMIVVAEQCGFNSNSTFYAAFKKFTNTTPAEYMKGVN